MSSRNLLVGLANSHSIGSLFVHSKEKIKGDIPQSVANEETKLKSQRLNKPFKEETKEQNIFKKRKKSRPFSAKSQVKKLRPTSGKRYQIDKNISKVKPRNVSKLSYTKDKSSTRKERLRLKNLKTNQKHSSLKHLLGDLDGHKSKKEKSLGKPKAYQTNLKENIDINNQRMNYNSSRSRQAKLCCSKSNTIVSSPRQTENLKLEKGFGNRKSSFVNLKRDKEGIQLIFAENVGKISDINCKNNLQNTHSSKGLKLLHNIEKDFKLEQSTSKAVHKNIDTNSTFESVHKKIPEIEYISCSKGKTPKNKIFSFQRSGRASAFSITKPTVIKKKTVMSSSRQLLRRDWATSRKECKHDKYTKELESFVNDLTGKIENDPIEKPHKPKDRSLNIKGFQKINTTAPKTSTMEKKQETELKNALEEINCFRTLTLKDITEAQKDCNKEPPNADKISSSDIEQIRKVKNSGVNWSCKNKQIDKKKNPIKKKNFMKISNKREGINIKRASIKKRRKGSKRKRKTSQKKLKNPHDLTRKARSMNRSGCEDEPTFSPFKEANSRSNKGKVSLCVLNPSRNCKKVSDRRKESKTHTLDCEKKSQKGSNNCEAEIGTIKKSKKNLTNSTGKRNTSEEKNYHFSSDHKNYQRNLLDETKIFANIKSDSKKAQKTVIKMPKVTNFLSTIEKNEHLTSGNEIRDPRNNPKRTETTQKQKSKRINPNKSRPLSGGPPQSNNPKDKSLVRKPIITTRPRTAKHPPIVLEGNQNVSNAPCNYESNGKDFDINSRCAPEKIHNDNKSQLSRLESCSKNSGNFMKDFRVVSSQGPQEIIVKDSLKQGSHPNLKIKSGSNFCKTKFGHLKQVVHQEQQKMQSRNNHPSRGLSGANSLKISLKNISEIDNDFQIYGLKERVDFNNKRIPQTNVKLRIKDSSSNKENKCMKINRPNSAKIISHNFGTKLLKRDPSVTIIKKQITEIQNEDKSEPNILNQDTHECHKIGSKISANIPSFEQYSNVSKKENVICNNPNLQKEIKALKQIETPSALECDLHAEKEDGDESSKSISKANQGQIPSNERNKARLAVISECGIHEIEASGSNKDKTKKGTQGVQYQDCRNFSYDDPKLHSTPLLNVTNKCNYEVNDKLCRVDDPQDDISIISSRIETNRKALNISNFDKLPRNHDGRVENTSFLRSVCKKVPICKNDIQLEKSRKNLAHVRSTDKTNKSSSAICNADKDKKCLDKEYSKSLTLLKRSTVKKHSKEFGKYKDSDDALIENYKSIKKKQSLVSLIKNIKPRPGSAGINPSNPLVTQKIKSSLMLLKKSILKSKKLGSNREPGKDFYNPFKTQEFQRESPKPQTSKFKRKTKSSSYSSKPPHKRKYFKSSKAIPPLHSAKEDPPNDLNGKILQQLLNPHKICQKEYLPTHPRNPSSRQPPNKSSNSTASQENESLDGSLFENSTFGLAFQIPEYTKFLKYQVKEFQVMSKTLEKETLKKTRELKTKLKNHKISDRSYIEEINMIQVKEKAKKKQIKTNKKNFIKMLGKLHKDSEKVNYRKEYKSSKNTSGISSETNSLQYEESHDNLNSIGKPDCFGARFGKKTLLTCDLSAINIFGVNSAPKNTSKIGKIFGGVKQNNISTDSTKAVKVMVGSEDKHLFSMIPFEEYKSKQMTSISPAGSFLESPVVAQNSYQDLKNIKNWIESNNLGIESCEEKKQEYEPSDVSHFSSLTSEIEETKGSQKQEQKDEVIPENQIAPTNQNEDACNTPLQSCADIEEGIKLPLIKTNSGQGGRRTSEEEPLDQEDDKNKSFGGDIESKSSKVDVFIPSKELSPKGNKNEHNSHLKTQIESIRKSDDAKICNKASGMLEAKAIVKSENGKLQPQELNKNEELLVKLISMKEPVVDPLTAMKQKLSPQARLSSTKNMKQMREQTEIISSITYDLILHDIFELMFPPKINVAALSKDYAHMPKHIAEDLYQKIDFSSSSESESDTELDQESSDSSTYSALKIPTDSAYVKQYISEVLQEIEKDMPSEIGENLSVPIKINDLILLRDLQGSEYTVDHIPGFETKSIIDIQVYLRKERTDKAAKENERKKLINSVIQKENSGSSHNIMKELDEKSVETTYSMLCEYQHIHNKAIFDALNEALDRRRPYGLRGCPPIWSRKLKVLSSNFSNICSLKNPSTQPIQNDSVGLILDQASKQVETWSKYFAGTLPTSELFQKNNLDDDESIDLKQAREDRLCCVISDEMDELSQRFIDIEHEFTTVKIDLANMISDTIVEETVTLLQEIEGNRA
ncbi:unnamed protein product [Moneuplotes crassus]|uniref:Uncharacterized protein n=1 Tax=Euplotes crassus TaxID=5936 RepID=A0AAD1XML9_EUPCR|nr:unnamed protein product [Moneuplotes crassus]